MAEEDFEEMIMDMEETSAIEDVSEEDYSDPLTGRIVQFVKDKYTKSETARQLDEERWIQAYRNYLCIYGPNLQFTSSEKSLVFVKVTKTKVLAAYGQIAEVLFGGNRFPISIDPTTLPDGIEDTVSFETNPEIRKAVSPELAELLPGETLPEFRERLGALSGVLEPVIDDVKSGTGKTPSAVQFHPEIGRAHV